MRSNFWKKREEKSFFPFKLKLDFWRERKETKKATEAAEASFLRSKFSGENIGFPSRMIFKLRFAFALVRIPIIVCNLSWQREEWNIKKLGLDKIKQKRMREDVCACVRVCVCACAQIHGCLCMRVNVCMCASVCVCAKKKERGTERVRNNYRGSLDKKMWLGEKFFFV